MLIAVPSVLNIIQASRIKSFVVYTNEMINKSSERLARSSIDEDEEKSCIIYDIKKDFEIDNTGDFVGWVLLNNDTDDKYITIYNDEYALVGYKVDKDKKIEDYLVKIDDSIKEKLNIETLCELSNCYTCSVSDEDPENGSDEIIPKNRIALLQTGKAVNKKIDELSGATGSYNDIIERIVFTNKIEDKTVNIADESSYYDIYLWVKDNVAYIGCESPVIYLNKDSKRFFGDFRSLVSIDGLYKLNTSLMTNAEYFFYYDRSLQSLDLSNFDTSNCTDFFCMFMYCYNLIELDLSSFDTSKVTTMNKMFCECRILEKINLSSFDTSKCRSFMSMFSYCYALKSLDIKHFNTERVDYMNSMFNHCESLESIDVSNFDTSNVEDMNDMFSNCLLIESLDLSNFNTYYVDNFTGMFWNCTNLKSLNISSFNTVNAENMSYMFAKLTKLRNLDLSHFNTNRVKGFNNMFESSSFDTLNLTSFDTDGIESAENIWDGITDLTIYLDKSIEKQFYAKGEEVFIFICNSSRL